MFIHGYRRKWDKSILLPAMVVVIQSIPWFAARLRLRVLVPLMVMYIVHAAASTKAKEFTNRKEYAAALNLLISCGAFLGSYMIMEIAYFREFSSGWLICSTFGLFYMWVFMGLAKQNKVQEIKILTLVTLAALFIGGYTGSSYLSSEENQNIIRSITGGSATDVDVRDAVMAGVGGYGFVYSIGMLAPALFYAGLKSRRYMRWVFWVSGSIFLLYSYRAGFSILMATIGLGFLCYALSYGVKATVNYRLTALFLVALVLLITVNPQVASFLVKPLTVLANTIGNENYVFRLTSVSDAMSGTGDEYALDRTGLMWKSWRVFLQYPFLGAPFTQGLVGGHSFFFDYLAMGGLVAFVPYPFFIYFYIKYLRLVVYPVSRSARVFIETYLFMFIFCTLMNPLNSATVWASFFLLLPGITLFFYDSRVKVKADPLFRGGFGHAVRTH